MSSVDIAPASTDRLRLGALAQPWQWVLAALLVAYPAVATDFFIFQIGGYALILGTIALSLMFLAGYGGVVSLAQMMIAGIAGYMVAIFGVNSADLGLGWPWWATRPATWTPSPGRD